jgi:hypothetical protein
VQLVYPTLHKELFANDEAQVLAAFLVAPLQVKSLPEQMVSFMITLSSFR